MGKAPTAFVAVYLRDPNAEWPVDIGDDPAFATSQRFHDADGVLSWGVCRPDLRNPAQPGDLVVFFCADRFVDRAPVRYCFVGYATVERKVSQQAIWEDDRLAVYRSYRNLLIRPVHDGLFEHYEPMERRFWHDDWLWRMTNHRGAAKSDLKHIEQGQTWEPGRHSVKGRPVRLAANYVLFAPEGDQTFVSARPPVVAEAAVNGMPETWLDLPVARELYELVVRGSATPRQGLRTTNRQTAHRHIRLASRPAQIRRELGDWCRRHAIRSR